MPLRRGIKKRARGPSVHKLNRHPADHLNLPWDRLRISWLSALLLLFVQNPIVCCERPGPTGYMATLLHHCHCRSGSDRGRCKLRRLRRGCPTVPCRHRLCSAGFNTTMRLFMSLPPCLATYYGCKTRRLRRAAARAGIGRRHTSALRRRNTTRHSSLVRAAERRRCGEHMEFAALLLAMYRLRERRSRAVQEQSNPSPAKMVVQRQTLPPVHRPSLTREQERRPSPSELIDGCCTCTAVQEQGLPSNRTEVVVGCCNLWLPEPRNTRQEQGNPNPAQLVYIIVK